MTLRRAMQALTDEQLHEQHSLAQQQVASYLSGGHHDIVGGPTRRAHAAQREILARAKYNRKHNA